GVPIPDLSLRVLDTQLAPQPIGIPGEICVGGAGLALGYLGRPELTAQRFVPDPFGSPGARLYRSGDLARYLPDGDLDYLGRIDLQVKIRGFRIELGEIETVLCAQPEIREAVVLAREDVPGDRRLVAYLIANREPSISELRERLRATLPEYMVPAAFVVLPALPLTGNGKVDRRALPPPEAAAPATRELVLPRTPLERDLADLWRTALGRAGEIGTGDDFFELGGSSITGALLINRLQERLGEIIHVVVIFDAPTIEKMASYLIENHAEAVARIWDVGGGEGARAPVERVDPAKLERMRALIRPLPPLAEREPKNPPALFILSPPRSGTTLMRVLLGGHPRLFAPPELELLSFNTLAERRSAYTGRDSFWLEGLVRAVMEIRGCDAEEATRITAAWEDEGWTCQRAYGQLQEWLGERSLVDKTPSYALDPATLRRAEEGFAEPIYIHLVRHPGGMIRSFEEAKLDQIFFRHEHGFDRRELAEMIWLVSHENILRFLEEIPSHRWHRVVFEELLREPEAVVRGLCDSLGLDFHPDMVRPYQERTRRMTDGLHAESRMLGDVKFHSYSGIDASVAERWRERSSEDLLGEPTTRLAAALGYEAAVRRPVSIPRRECREGEPAPLSFSQERLWFLDRIEPGSAFYNIPAALRLTGKLDAGALERTLAEIRRRHAVLRTVFLALPEGPVQVVAGPPPVEMPWVDLSALPEAVRNAEISRLATGEARLPFDLSAGPLLRARLVRAAGAEHILLITMHHIASDGWSMGVFLSELAALYEAFTAGRPSPLPELPLQYADFAAWQRERLHGAALDALLAHWRERLAGAPPVLALPADRPRPAVQRFRGSQVAIHLDEDLSSRLNALGQRRGATLFMTLLAAFQTVLARWAGQEDVTIGSPFAGRLWPEAEPLIGFFVNTLVLRTRMADDPGFEVLLARVQRTTIEALAHQELPFEKLVEALQPERSLAHSPLFQVLFAFQNAPRKPLALPGLELSAVHAEGGTAKFDLSLGLTERSGRIAGGIEYDADLFDAPTVSRLLGGFTELLRSVAREPGRRLSELPLLSAPECQQLLEWNDTEQSFPEAGFCLHELVAAQAERSPTAPAVVFEGESLTYGALDRRARRLARTLRLLGAGPERRVGVLMERSLDVVVALLG
ncbi:MAG TPA: condensation domain-containing protein, partial [Thermoanaerobaculia bacterium]|nr:condensation domain-containing protein [Thermoanaerobaculia bacterium]